MDSQTVLIWQPMDILKVQEVNPEKVAWRALKTLNIGTLEYQR